MHFLIGSVPIPWDYKALQKGWREGNHGLVPTVDTGIFPLLLDGWLAPLGFISLGADGSSLTCRKVDICHLLWPAALLFMLCRYTAWGNVRPAVQ